jgi:hypothetical protein
MAAKHGDMDSAKQLARELVSSRKAKERIYKSKAQLHSVTMSLQKSIGERVFDRPSFFFSSSQRIKLISFFLSFFLLDGL